MAALLFPLSSLTREVGPRTGYAHSMAELRGNCQLECGGGGLLGEDFQRCLKACPFLWRSG